ncbi:MAG: phosphotransferase [Phycisphaerales bacterium]
MPAATAERNEPQPAGTERVLKRESGRGVFLVREPDGSRVLVKRWPFSPWECVKLVLGISQAQRQLRGARRLAAARVATPRPRRGTRVVRDHGLFTEVRLEWIDGEPLLDRVVRADAAEQGRLGEAMAAILRRLAAARLFHRDAKLSNFIVTPAGEVVAIDPVGVRRSRDPARERDRASHALACELSPPDRERAAEFLRAASVAST